MERLEQLQSAQPSTMSRSYYDKFWEATGEDSMGQSTPPATNRWRRWQESGTGGVSSGDQAGSEFSPGCESEEKLSSRRAPAGMAWLRMVRGAGVRRLSGRAMAWAAGVAADGAAMNIGAGSLSVAARHQAGLARRSSTRRSGTM